ncbi:UMP kinase [Candidatus Woesearchaeota archaeon]|nr:UMP kinase [Candidatus Woesearchaeota archaeon]
MKKEILVFSLGGSLIVPDKVDYKYLHKFKSFINKLRKFYDIIIVTGGGKTARNYIKAVKNEKLKPYYQSLVGIESTKLNARLVAGFLDLSCRIPDSLKEVKEELFNHKVVVSGALGFQPDMTSDSNAAQIASYTKAKYFINLTNVNGLYDKDPNKYKNAKLISNITFKNFLLTVNKIKYEAGQHFVLDQAAAEIIDNKKIKTVIINGKNLNNLNNFILNKGFIGTLII